MGPPSDAGAAQSSTSVTNLLRAVRAECGGQLVFLALEQGSHTEVACYPTVGSTEWLANGAIEELATECLADPEFGHGRTFVRSLRATSRTTLAVASLVDDGTRGMLGLLAGADHRFEPQSLAALDRAARRVARHLRARREVSERLERAAAAPDERAPTGHTVGDGPAWPVGQLPGRSPEARGHEPPATHALVTGEPDGPATWTEPGDVPGLVGLGHFFSRGGRLLGGGAHAPAVAVVVVDVGSPAPAAAAAAAAALRAQLRFSDPLTRISPGAFAAVVTLFPGSATGDAVETRLAEAVRAALGGPCAVRSAYVVAEPGDRRELDELLQRALGALRAR